MKKFVCIRYFWALPHLYYADFENDEGNVEAGIEDIRDVEGTEVGGILGKRYVGETSWYMELLRVSSELSFVFLLRFLFVSITGL